MSVIVYFDLFSPHCDCCGHTLAAEKNEANARAAMERDGWGTQTIPGGTIKTSDCFLLPPPDAEGTQKIDACTLCVREGRTYADRMREREKRHAALRPSVPEQQDGRRSGS